MLRKLLTEDQVIDQSHLVENIYHSLQQIQKRLEEEMSAKQKNLESSLEEIKKLHLTIDNKEASIQKLEVKLTDCQRNIDGNRQLINKLLNDLERAQQDIEWYKRTYETRSLFGTIKQKLIGKSVRK